LGDLGDFGELVNFGDLGDFGELVNFCDLGDFGDLGDLADFALFTKLVSTDKLRLSFTKLMSPSL
jgi:hypothetical protein